MTLRLYNTLTRQVEPFEPLEQGRVRMYVCGPTVYDDPHIGHARSAYVFDVIRQYLARHYEVTFVRNVTDVDDKIIERAKVEQTSPQDVAEKYLTSYQRAMAALGIAQPTIEPRATAHIDDMVELISRLIARQLAYEAAGNVYYSVRKFPAYGQLAHQQLEAMQVGTRAEPEPGKQFPLDFALWKAAKPDELSWSSPWGAGRPGWHIECSAMSMHCLKTETLDIHGGGLDLIFPHHENEIAQSEGATGTHPFAKYWLHHGLLTINSQKMSKSIGNVITVEDAIAACDGETDALKIFFLGTHYRSPIDYSNDNLNAAIGRYDGIVDFLLRADARAKTHGLDLQHIPLPKPSKVSELELAFEEAMNNDINTPQSLAVIDRLVYFGNFECKAPTLLKQQLHPDDKPPLTTLETYGKMAADMAHAATTIRDLAKVLGITFQSIVLTEKQLSLIEERTKLRQERRFQEADESRQQLLAEDILLEDTVDGTIWRRKRSWE